MAKAGRKRKPKPEAETALATIGHSKAHVEIIDIDNPYFNAAQEGESGNVKKIRAAVNMMESPAAHWLHKGLIDVAEYRAASHFRSLFERAGGTGAKAMDFTREKVDGGGFITPISDSRIDATNKLAELHGVIGHDGFGLMTTLCGQCTPMGEAFVTKHMQDKAGKLCRELLTRLAEYWGWKSRPTRSIRAA